MTFWRAESIHWRAESSRLGDSALAESAANRERSSGVMYMEYGGTETTTAGTHLTVSSSESHSTKQSPKKFLHRLAEL